MTSKKSADAAGRLLEAATGNAVSHPCRPNRCPGAILSGASTKIRRQVCEAQTEPGCGLCIRCSDLERGIRQDARERAATADAPAGRSGRRRGTWGNRD
jgi:hypothetical protein